MMADEKKKADARRELEKAKQRLLEVAAEFHRYVEGVREAEAEQREASKRRLH
jgi:hypothetical protein